jgi:hypothetical protein
MECLSQDMRYRTTFPGKQVPSLSPAILSIIAPFAILFSSPVWNNAITLFIGAILFFLPFKQHLQSKSVFFQIFNITCCLKSIMSEERAQNRNFKLSEKLLISYPHAF